MRKLAVVLMLAVPSLAGAQCVAATECVCEVQAPTVVLGHVVAFGTDTVSVSVDQVIVELDGGAPSSIDVAGQAGDVVGEKLLVGIDPPSIPFRVTVGAGDAIACGTTPGAIPLSKAIDALRAHDCNASLHDAGFAEPPCNDTSGCGAVSPSFAALALVASVGLLALRRART